MTNNPFTLSVEPVGGSTYQHPFHLGTDERIARQLAEEIFHGRSNVTVALIRDRRTIDVFDGQWSSDWPVTNL